jgi:hypothetical protein
MDEQAPKERTAMQRYALSFVVRPGSEDEVTRILSHYGRPAPVVDRYTRLLRTSVFIRGTRVVRVMDIEGDMRAALRHLAAQPAVRDVEAAINPHLVERRDLDDPASAGAFFTRAALHRVGGEPPVPDGAERRGVLVPVRAGRGDAVAAALADLDGAAPDSARGTVFARGDVVVWLLDGAAPLDGGLTALADSAAAGPAADALAGALALDADLRTPDGWRALIRAGAMRLLTDRRATHRAHPQPEGSSTS